MGINLKFPLRSYRKGFFEMNQTTLDAVREDIRILLLTKKGERVVNPDIGTNIPILMGQLFEPIKKQELEDNIGREIKSALQSWMPYVTLEKIEVFSEVDPPKGISLNSNQVLIKMSYRLNNNEALRDSIQLTINGAPR